MIDIVLGLLIVLLLGIPIFILGFLFHELAHILEGKRQGSTEGVITIHMHENKLPSMTVTANNVKNITHFLWAGGLYTALIFFMLGLFTYLIPSIWAFPLEFGFTTVALMNLFYAPYEGTFLTKWTHEKYLKWHYVMYILGGLVSIVIHIPRFIELFNSI